MFDNLPPRSPHQGGKLKGARRDERGRSRAAGRADGCRGRIARVRGVVVVRIVGAGRTPKEAIAKINGEVAKWLYHAGAKEKLASRGAIAA